MNEYDDEELVAGLLLRTGLCQNIIH